MNKRKNRAQNFQQLKSILLPDGIPSKRQKTSSEDEDIFDFFKDSSFEKRLSCHSAFGQIMDLFTINKFSHEILNEGKKINGIELPITIDNFKTVFMYLLKFTEEYPKVHIFLRCETVLHSFQLNFINNQVRILSSWEGYYCYETYHSNNKYGKLISSPEKKNMMLENLILLFKIHSFVPEIYDKYYVEKKDDLISVLKDLYEELFKPEGVEMGFSHSSIWTIEKLWEIHDIQDEATKVWKMESNDRGNNIGAFIDYFYPPLYGGKKKTKRKKRKTKRKKRKTKRKKHRKKTRKRRKKQKKKKK